MPREASNQDAREKRRDGKTSDDGKRTAASEGSVSLPALALPKGGGAIRGIEEKFQVNAITGTTSFSIPIPVSPSRHGSLPAIELNYNSGNGNGPFGIGWRVDIPGIKRKTEKQLPQYEDSSDSDTFIISDAEDLVPFLREGLWEPDVSPRTENGVLFSVVRYRPRVEGGFTRIERWRDTTTNESHWRTISRDNVHSYYGLTPESRITNPHDDSQVFEWKLCVTHDDKGSIAFYRYKKEDFAGVPGKTSEKNKIGNCTQLYIKEVFYGNRDPYYLGSPLPEPGAFLFRIIFDYGEHSGAVPAPKDIHAESNPWPCRKDPFSTYQAGFEIRTYRRCSRVLLFHCFDEPDLPHSPYLVKSLELSYDDHLGPGTQNSAAGFSFLVKARQCGHKWEPIRNAYATRHLPDFDLSYQPHEWNTAVTNLSAADSLHAPVGIDDKSYLWVDLFSEGIAGILTEQTNEWFYKSNLGGGEFSGAVRIAPRPSFAAGPSIQELEGNGVKYLVRLDEPRGFFKLSDSGEWEGFRAFTTFPNIDTTDPNLRAIDLNGDGRADLLITEDKLLRWYPSAGERGFDVSRTLTRAIDEEKGPAIVFADQTQSIFLADMSGDGMTDIVRIRNGEICYWPNLGYGRFGAKVNMENAPLFDHPDAYNPAYLRLADIDGSGTIDVVYLGHNDFRVWMNLSGNEWSLEPQIIPAFPSIDNLSDVAVLDFLGSGTACIVHSSPLPRDSRSPLRYIDLMGGKKPHVLTSYQNNCGQEVTLEYKSSTHFYLEDKKRGMPWITKLPFPVHCVSRVRIEDKIRETVFSNSYRYSHGYFDHDEREFRGFARVEQLDTEEFRQFRLNTARNVVAEDLHQPPVRTISWFHTGAFLNQDSILHQCQAEYFRNGAVREYEMPEPLINDDLTAEELREALRACKGLPLRVEVYANDGLPSSNKPYSAAQSNCEIRRIQPKLNNRFACFMVLPSESISYSYERNPADPRVSHSFVLETDELGNVTRSASVVYPRIARPPAPHQIPDIVWETQNRLHVVYGETLFTGDIVSDDVYRLRVGYESSSYEVSGIAIPAGGFFGRQGLFDQIEASTVIPFEEEFAGGPQKRRSTHSRQYFWNDDLSRALPLGQLSSLGIGQRSYQLAFTSRLVSKYYDTKVTDLMLSDAKYVHLEGDNDWWAPTGIAIYDANPRNNFFTPIGARDLFGNESFVEYDRYTLLGTSATDAIQNRVTATNDYRTLSPALITDPNLNRGAVETDELGFVIKSAVMGKEGAGEGDTLADPTARMEYNLFNWANNRRPNYIHTFAREQHGPANPRWQESYAFSDGGGSVIMTKAQAEPGKAKVWNRVTRQVDEVDADPRWVGNGRTILNNKGNPVKQYEPYFSTTFGYENEDALVETGITAINYYDPLGRNIRIEYPNGTFSKVEHDAWQLKAFDVYDTVRDSRWYRERGSPDPLSIPEPTDPEQRAAWLAAKHHNTPGTIHTDSLGRTIYATTDYGGGKTTSVYSETDLVGRFAKVFDQLGRNVSEAYTNLLGVPIYGKSAEKGERWTFNDALGRIVKVWDNDVREFRSTFDKLHRPVSTFVKEGGNETLFGHVVYGEIFADAAQRNLKGQAFQLYDQAGAITLKQVDFKGNVVRVERKLATTYDRALNWSMLDGLTSEDAINAAAASSLEREVFSSSVVLDALNRPTLVTLPDNSLVEPRYNEANSLDSLRVKIRGEGDFVTFLENQDYDAKGQRQFAQYGNGLITKYSYDPKTFRLTNLLTKPVGSSDAQSLQNLSYTFDPRGNIVYSIDDAQPTHYFANALVRAESKFEYDAIYQLVKATGREHAGLGGNAQRDNNDLPFLAQLPHVNDLNAVRQYTEVYQYDDCGNFSALQHIAAGGSWTQRCHYEYQDDPANKTNRLKSTSLPDDAELGPYTATYQHDLHGNMTRMPHLSELVWNSMDQLASVNLGGGGSAFYVYGVGGSRIRKVIQRPSGKRIERIYLGPVEIYREFQSGTKKLERRTLHISDNTGRIAQVDAKILDEDNVDAANPLNTNLIRYQFGNHLGSVTLETDEHGAVVSYEEYHPYGTSAYRSSKSDVDLSLKRYRFCGKERDDETGLYYIGARYYAAWLGRWTSSDPAGFADGLNLYRYCRNSPIVLSDPSGLAPPDQVGFPIPANLAPNITTPTPEAGAALERHIENTSYSIEGHAYRFEGNVEWAGGQWQYTWTRWTEINPGTNAVVGSGGRADAAPGQAPSPSPPAAPPEVAPSPPATTSSEPPPSASAAPDSTASPPADAPRPDSLTHAGPGLERGIWARSFRDRGFILEHLYSNNIRAAIRAQGDNRPLYDINDARTNRVKQIKSSSGGSATLEAHGSRGTRDAGMAIERNPTTMAGRNPQAVVITPTDAPASAGSDIRAGYDKIRRPVPNSVPPEHVRGLPGAVGHIGRALTVLGTGLSLFAFGSDVARGDAPMAGGDALSTVGGGLELYAIARAGATVGGFSAMSAGLVLGGAGIAVTSAVSGYRAYRAHDRPGVIAGIVGVAAGAAIIIGVAFSAGPLIVGGLVLAAAVGVFHLWRHFSH